MTSVITPPVTFAACTNSDFKSVEDSIVYWEGEVLEGQFMLRELVGEDSPEEFARITKDIIRCKGHATFWQPYRGNCQHIIGFCIIFHLLAVSFCFLSLVVCVYVFSDFPTHGHTCDVLVSGDCCVSANHYPPGKWITLDRAEQRIRDVRDGIVRTRSLVEQLKISRCKGMSC